MADEKTEIVVEEKKVEEAADHDAPSNAEPDLKFFESFLELQEPSTVQKEQLKVVYEWLAKRENVKSEPSLLMALRGIENRLSAPKLGETRLGKIYHYVKAQKTVESAERWRNSFLS